MRARPPFSHPTQVTNPLFRAARREIDARLAARRTAADAGSLAAAVDHAARLGARVHGPSL
jgi:hypothetical protein